MYTDALPLRAILFQLLFIVIAIAIESIVLQRYLGIGRKISIQYAATANLLSTIVGWLLFFVIQPWLPASLRTQLISYIFFDRTNSPPLLIGLAFITFIGTFLIKLQSIEWLDLILGIRKPAPAEVQDTAKFRGRAAQRQPFVNLPNRALSILWANAASFSAITFIIAIRIFYQSSNNN
jgi:hypothetical protein